MANFGTRTVHFKDDGYVIHFNNAEWRPASGFTGAMTGDRLYVTVNQDGTLTATREDYVTEIWGMSKYPSKATCRHCRKPILWEEGDWGGHWVHIDSLRVRCSDTNIEAEPDTNRWPERLVP